MVTRCSYQRPRWRYKGLLFSGLQLCWSLRFGLVLKLVSVVTCGPVFPYELKSKWQPWPLSDSHPSQHTLCTRTGLSWLDPAFYSTAIPSFMEAWVLGAQWPPVHMHAHVVWYGSLQAGLHTQPSPFLLLGIPSCPSQTQRGGRLLSLKPLTPLPVLFLPDSQGWETWIHFPFATFCCSAKCFICLFAQHWGRLVVQDF